MKYFALTLFWKKDLCRSRESAVHWYRGYSRPTGKPTIVTECFGVKIPLFFERPTHGSTKRSIRWKVYFSIHIFDRNPWLIGYQNLIRYKKHPISENRGYFNHELPFSREISRPNALLLKEIAKIINFLTNLVAFKA